VSIELGSAAVYQLVSPTLATASKRGSTIGTMARTKAGTSAEDAVAARFDRIGDLDRNPLERRRDDQELGNQVQDRSLGRSLLAHRLARRGDVGHRREGIGARQVLVRPVEQRHAIGHVRVRRDHSPHGVALERGGRDAQSGRNPRQRLEVVVNDDLLVIGTMPPQVVSA